jgi:hypothetical protein
MCRKCDDAGGTSNKLDTYRISLGYVKQLRSVIALPAAQDAPSPRIGPDTWHSKAPSYESVMGTSVQSEAHRRAIYRRYHGTVCRFQLFSSQSFANEVSTCRAVEHRPCRRCMTTVGYSVDVYVCIMHRSQAVPCIRISSSLGRALDNNTRGSTALLRSPTDVPFPLLLQIRRIYPDRSDQLQANATLSWNRDRIA